RWDSSKHRGGTGHVLAPALPYDPELEPELDLQLPRSVPPSNSVRDDIHAITPVAGPNRRSRFPWILGATSATCALGVGLILNPPDWVASRTKALGLQRLISWGNYAPSAVRQGGGSGATEQARMVVRDQTAPVNELLPLGISLD